MTATPPEKPAFQKAEVSCLYRYISNGVYYALARLEGKQKRALRKTADQAAVKRKPIEILRDLGKVHFSWERLPLLEPSNCFLTTGKNRSAAITRHRKDIMARPLADVPVRSDVPVPKVEISDVEA